MNMTEIQTEPGEVQPGSPAAEVLTASVEEKFAALFKAVHPPVTTWKPLSAFEASTAFDMMESETEVVPGMTVPHYA